MEDQTEDIALLTRLAASCNESPLFVERHWVEMPETVRELMATPAFKDAIKELRGLSLSDTHLVSALFHARESEVKKTKRIPRLSWRSNRR